MASTPDSKLAEKPLGFVAGSSSTACEYFCSISFLSSAAILSLCSLLSAIRAADFMSDVWSALSL